MKQKIVLTDGSRMDEAAKDANLIVMAFGRDNVEKCLIGDALDRLLSLSDNPDHVRRFKDKVVLYFPGYDHDKRELFEIPECRRFFKELDAQWPFWFHFLEKDSYSVSLALRLACDMRCFLHHGRKVAEFRDARQVQQRMLKWFTDMNRLHVRWGVSDAENEAMTPIIVDACMRGIA